MSEEQERLLVRSFRHVVLLLDSDEAGGQAAAEIAARLVRSTFVQVVEVPAKQPDQMEAEELAELLRGI